MNRWDEIKGAALDVANHVTQDPAERDALADDLVILIGHMLSGVGKVMAVDGEGAMNSTNCNDPDCDCKENGCEAEFRQQHTLYLAGESMQEATEQVVAETGATDLPRWEDLADNKYGWNPKCRVCGLRQVHKMDCGGAS